MCKRLHHVNRLIQLNQCPWYIDLFIQVFHAVAVFWDRWTAGKAAGCHRHVRKEQFHVLLFFCFVCFFVFNYYYIQGSAQVQCYMGHLNFRSSRTDWVLGLRTGPLGHVLWNVTVHSISKFSLFSVTSSGLFMWITWEAITLTWLVCTLKVISSLCSFARGILCYIPGGCTVVFPSVQTPF